MERNSDKYARERIRKALETAELYASSPSPYLAGMNIQLMDVKAYAEEAGIDLSDKIKEIRLRGFGISIDEEIRAACHAVEKGPIKDMAYSLEKAISYAKSIGKDISRMVREIEIKGCFKGVVESLEIAKSCAQNENDYLTLHSALEYAKEYAGKIGMNIDDELEEIESIAFPGEMDIRYRKAVDESLSAARTISQRNTTIRDSLLKAALEFAERGGIDITDEVEKIKG